MLLWQFKIDKGRVRHRSEYDIAAEILVVIGSPTVANHVMQSANLGFVQLKYYRTMLVEGELMQITDDFRWVITEKGRKYLAAYQEAVKIFQSRTRA